MSQSARTGRKVQPNAAPDISLVPDAPAPAPAKSSAAPTADGKAPPRATLDDPGGICILPGSGRTSRAMARSVIDVAVAVVRNADGHVLLAERTARQVAAGFWELPGGKIEHGETPAQAASRELLEETGLLAGPLQHLMAYDHAFPTKIVRLHIFLVSGWQGTPDGREGQRLAWTDPARPSVSPILPSNHRVLRALGLPSRMDIIDLDAAAPLARAHAALSSGVRLLLLRGAGLSPDQRVAIARRLCQSANSAGASAVLAGSLQEAVRAGATGLHSDAAALRCVTARPAVPLWSVGCHGDDDIRRAEALGADLAITPSACAGPFLRIATPWNVPVYSNGIVDPASQDRPGAGSEIAAGIAPVPRPWMTVRGAVVAARYRQN